MLMCIQGRKKEACSIKRGQPWCSFALFNSLTILLLSEFGIFKVLTLTLHILSAITFGLTLQFMFFHYPCRADRPWRCKVSGFKRISLFYSSSFFYLAWNSQPMFNCLLPKVTLSPHDLHERHCSSHSVQRGTPQTRIISWRAGPL